jgi:hypothetical protein
MSEITRTQFCWLNPKLEVRATNSIGLGIFACEAIAKHERLIIYGGRILPLVSELELPEGFQDVSLQLDENYVIGIRNVDEMEMACFLNHSCCPNAGYHGQVFLVAMNPIQSGEQVCIDYAMCISRSPAAMRYEMNCLCGSPDCRGIITEDDWQIPDLQRRYAGYFQWYLQEKIDAARSK